ncbi:MAG: sulfate adenylyltransferase subunit CysD [Pseudomonadota bacterium]
MEWPTSARSNRVDSNGNASYWDLPALAAALEAQGHSRTLRSVERDVEQTSLLPQALALDSLRATDGSPGRQLVIDRFSARARKRRQHCFVVQLHRSDLGLVLCANDGRMARRWVYLEDTSAASLLTGLDQLVDGRATLFWPHGALVDLCRPLTGDGAAHDVALPSGTRALLGVFAFPRLQGRLAAEPGVERVRSGEGPNGLTHLDRLEAESVHIIREVMALAQNPVMLYSLGKDSSVMLHLARKAFYPSPPPFPLLHVDTRWKFQAMYRFRDLVAQESGMQMLVHVNPDGVARDMNPFDHGSALHTDVMKTQGLKQALNEHKFDVAFGGARRDEEKSRAKERVFSFRNEAHRWDPKNQRPELWNLYNGHKREGESIRVFPLSNWTELDIWQYIYRESIPLVPLYFAAERPVVERDGTLIMVDDDRMRLHDDEEIMLKKVRFRTLGCYPLTGAVESDADDLSSIVLELLRSRVSERQGRTIDADASASMEQKKQEGYF